VRLADAEAVVGVAGTVTTVAALAVKWGLSNDARFLSAEVANASAPRIRATSQSGTSRVTKQARRPGVADRTRDEPLGAAPGRR
jgi:hypothetical protein